MDNLIILIGNNLSKIRKERGLSLDQVSSLTRVSKGMLSQIEKGQKTPSVTILWKIASGLKVSISELMKNNQSHIEIISLDKSELLIEDGGRYRSGSFLPFDADTKFEVLKMELEPGCVHRSNPHTKGVKEYVLVSTGCLEMEIEDAVYKVCSGEAIVFQGDIYHTYKNSGNELVNTFILIYYPS
ncbi:transcriptional regulator ClgR [Oxobacter pfennigii]|uniref:Transcriptional regulator ClgR n=1 Tax=Oxobacter pfennigii TaxID=36849 RepID=A0A0N8NTB4_9CLOT|nr:helix-turn-helix transcriptional regulator [Oxobacter pfennigii]KPU44360.1 transcriptional regulator ClgR [Oxobacter pfennigii]